MKTPKKSSKESSLPSQDEYRRFNVLTEQMLSKIDVIGEAQVAMRERLDQMEPDLHAVKEDIVVLKAAARTHTDILKTHTDAIHANTEAIQSMHADFKNINQRLEIVEAKPAQ